MSTFQLRKNSHDNEAPCALPWLSREISPVCTKLGAPQTPLLLDRQPKLPRPKTPTLKLNSKYELNKLEKTGLKKKNKLH